MGRCRNGRRCGLVQMSPLMETLKWNGAKTVNAVKCQRRASRKKKFFQASVETLHPAPKGIIPMVKTKSRPQTERVVKTIVVRKSAALRAWEFNSPSAHHIILKIQRSGTQTGKAASLKKMWFNRTLRVRSSPGAIHF